jgi:hypothetical protein
VGRGILWRGEGFEKVGGGLLTVIEHGRRNSVVPQFFGKKRLFGGSWSMRRLFGIFHPYRLEHFKSGHGAAAALGRWGGYSHKKEAALA